MSWEVRYLPEVLDDFRALDGSQRILVKKAIAKVSTNPLPEAEGGYGKPLGNKGGNQLSGFLKIKLRGAGLRVVYQLVREEDHMVLIVIGAREDDEVYNIAHRRIQGHNLQSE
ncbi:MAG: type II toxin-antitoxin system RelE/ParE family toxin [Oscillospiraceae bacterium]|nr:type II toxin-antitoxin system RelE/ParE family toxin [Oscillospiraceae bacterium]